MNGFLRDCHARHSRTSRWLERVLFVASLPGLTDDEGRLSHALVAELCCFSPSRVCLQRCVCQFARPAMETSGRLSPTAQVGVVWDSNCLLPIGATFSGCAASIPRLSTWGHVLIVTGTDLPD